MLPRFKVEIEAQDEFTVKSEVIRAVISAKYTYGKPLKGKATVSISEREPYGCPPFGFRIVDVETKEEKPLCKKVVDIDGRGSVEFDIEKDLACSYEARNREYRNLEIGVEVEEELTGSFN